MTARRLCQRVFVQNKRAKCVMRVQLAALCAVLGLCVAPSLGDEVVVQIDSLGAGDNGTICPCFVAGEEAAVWLTSPCDGSIVAFQIFWRSQFGGEPVSLEDSIVVYNGGNFPNPGTVKSELLAPALQDGGLNVFTHTDENQTIPINIPVSANEEFVVSLKFFNNSTLTAPSIIFDDSGITPNKNAIKFANGVWNSAESLGVTGDWVIRVVIDCAGGLVGSACLADGSCVDGVTEDEALLLGGVWSGEGSTCATSACVGACGIETTGACVQLDKSTCDLVGGEWFGPGTSECVSTCPGDLTGDGELDFLDISAFLNAFAGELPAADFNMDGEYDFLDISAFLAAFGQGCP